MKYRRKPLPVRPRVTCIYLSSHSSAGCTNYSKLPGSRTTMKLSLKRCFQRNDTPTAMMKKQAPSVTYQLPISTMNATASLKKREGLPCRLRDVFRRFFKGALKLIARNTIVTTSTSNLPQSGTDVRLSMQHISVVDSGFFIRTNSIVDDSNSSEIHPNDYLGAPIVSYTFSDSAVSDVNTANHGQYSDTLGAAPAGGDSSFVSRLPKPRHSPIVYCRR